jgi:VWFA-related protein
MMFRGKKMKKRGFLLILCFLSVIPLSSQEQAQEAKVINIEVPVRVYDGRNFVDTLTIDDFEIYENGILQKIEALYLFNQEELSRKEEYTTLERNQQRHIYFLMQIIDYTPKISEAIEYFFHNVLTPDDTLTIATVVKTYTLSPKGLKIRAKEKLADEMISIIQKDTETGNSNYKTLYNSLRRIIRALLSACGIRISGVDRITEIGVGDEGLSAYDVPSLLTQYRVFLDRFDDVKVLDERALKELAHGLKQQTGRKDVFLFYQREYKPELEDRYMNILMSVYQENTYVQGLIQDVFTAYSSKLGLDITGLKRACADSGAMFNFIYSDNQTTVPAGVRMKEQSQDYYIAFSEMASATGGKVATSFDPLAGFLECLESSQKYYLLYYTPTDLTEDGLFRTISVKLKNFPYTLSHRMGYFAIKD